jgi:hypothetical protein
MTTTARTFTTNFGSSQQMDIHKAIVQAGDCYCWSRRPFRSSKVLVASVRSHGFKVLAIKYPRSRALQKTNAAKDQASSSDVSHGIKPSAALWSLSASK